MLVPITAATTALLALLLLLLAILTVRQRLRAKAAFGDAGNPALIAASRSHGNLAEHAPIVIIMLGIVEFAASAHSNVILAIAAAFVIGRIAHAIGLHQPSPPGKAPLLRQIGVILTWLVILILATLILWDVLR